MIKLLHFKHLSKIKSILLMVLILVAFLIDQKHFDEVILNTKQTQKNQIQIPKSANVINADNHFQVKSISKPEYNQLSIDIKNNIYNNCREYFFLMKRGNDPLITQIKLYQKVNKNPLQEAQINALEKINKKCEYYLAFQHLLKQDLSSDLFFNYGKQVNNYFNKLNQLASHGELKLAINEAKINLFNHATIYRKGALQFLTQNSRWPDGINLQIGINEPFLKNTKDSLYRAIELRICELNLEDCSETSFDMLLNCVFDYETCGLSLYEHTVKFTSKSEIDLIELYLNYFREAN